MAMPAKTDPLSSSDPALGPATVSPFVSLMRRLGVWRPPEAASPDPEDLRALDAGAALRNQAEVFQTITVGDVMTPRADITAVELSTPFAEVVAAFAESEHSRIPVYRESLDDPVGVAHLKDVFRLMANPDQAVDPKAEILARLKRPTLYVPASMRAADLMVRMQSTRIHMAMVIDEFGGVDGLVTLEDVIESVVGEIDDEHDEAASSQILARAGGVFEIDGRVTLEALEAALGAELAVPDHEEAVETAAGLVTALVGRVPERGEVISHPAGFEFEITEADPRRIKRLRVRPSAPPEARVPSSV
jgi:CBS domain containing-hemolysin-like protein